MTDRRRRCAALAIMLAVFAGAMPLPAAAQTRIDREINAVPSGDCAAVNRFAAAFRDHPRYSSYSGRVATMRRQACRPVVQAAPRPAPPAPPRVQPAPVRVARVQPQQAPRPAVRATPQRPPAPVRIPPVREARVVRPTPRPIQAAARNPVPARPRAVQPAPTRVATVAPRTVQRPAPNIARVQSNAATRRLGRADARPLVRPGWRSGGAEAVPLPGPGFSQGAGPGEAVPVAGPYRTQASVQVPLPGESGPAFLRAAEVAELYRRYIFCYGYQRRDNSCSEVETLDEAGPDTLRVSHRAAYRTLEDNGLLRYAGQWDDHPARAWVSIPQTLGMTDDALCRSRRGIVSDLASAELAFSAGARGEALEPVDGAVLARFREDSQREELRAARNLTCARYREVDEGVLEEVVTVDGRAQGPVIVTLIPIDEDAWQLRPAD